MRRAVALDPRLDRLEFLVVHARIVALDRLDRSARSTTYFSILEPPLEIEIQNTLRHPCSELRLDAK
jgi:hypothetical protein